MVNGNTCGKCLWHVTIRRVGLFENFVPLLGCFSRVDLYARSVYMQEIYDNLIVTLKKATEKSVDKYYSFLFLSLFNFKFFSAIIKITLQSQNQDFANSIRQKRIVWKVSYFCVVLSIPVKLKCITDGGLGAELPVAGQFSNFSKKIVLFGLLFVWVFYLLEKTKLLKFRYHLKEFSCPAPTPSGRSTPNTFVN